MIPSIVTRCAIGATLLVAWSSSAWPARVLQAPGGGAVRALVIGIDKYPKLSGADLNGATADANDMARTLKSAGIPDANVRTLTDGDAVRSRVIAEMDRLVSESKSGDLVIISYSGHGMRVSAYKRWDGLDKSGLHSQMALSNFSPTDMKNGHEVIVDREMRAWYARLDAKGVDVLVVMDTCYGGKMRDVVPGAAGMKVRELNTTVINDKVHDTFDPIKMSEKEARADTNAMPHVTFFAGATEQSVVPEIPGVDRANPTVVRGALSYFIARAIEGKVSDDKVTREQLLKFVKPNVRAVTDGRQFIAFGPETGSAEAMQQVVFRVADKANEMPSRDPEPPPPVTPPVADPNPPQADPVRVAIANGSKELFSNIEPGRAPFVPSEAAEADVIWDVGNGTALSRGDLIMSKVDGSVLGAVIDRTWAVREIQKQATTRIIDVTMGENGRSYTLNEEPKLVADGVRGNYLTVVNVASDGTLQLLFPVYPSQEPRMSTDKWTYPLKVDLPFGTDYTVVVATSTAAPAKELTQWLHTHDQKHDAFALPDVLKKTIQADGKTRLGTAGLFTH